MSLAPATPLVYLITKGDTNPSTTRNSQEFLQILHLAESAVKAAVDLFQIREKNLPARTLYELTSAVSSITRHTNTRLLVNDRSDVAAAAGADGVHLAGNSISADVIRKTFGADFLVGVSTHSMHEAAAARRDGADFVVFGPVFETESKQAFGPPVGLETLREACSKLSPFPVLALGGVTPENAASCIDAGARGVAAIRMLNDAAQLRHLVNLIHQHSA